MHSFPKERQTILSVIKVLTHIKEVKTMDFNQKNNNNNNQKDNNQKNNQKDNNQKDNQRQNQENNR